MLNNITIMGRVCHTPELKHTRDGDAVCTISVAVDRDYTGGHGEKKTDFFSCVAWRKTADFISRYFSKGRLILISGAMQSRQYEKDGQKRTVWEIAVSRVWFAGDKPPADYDDSIPPEDEDENPDLQSPMFTGQSGADLSELAEEDLPF